MWVALARKNRLLCEEARRTLYHSVDYKGDEYRGAPSSVFLNNPHLATYLISCTIRCDHESPAPLDHPACSILRPGPVLASMTNLKELFIKVGEDYPPDMLESCPFKLYSFSWYHEIEGADFANLASFLDEQDELRHLQADWTYHPHGTGSSKPAVLLPSVCPKLEQLNGNHGIIEMVLPHRKLRTLVWDTLWGDPRTSFKHLAKEFSHLEAFSCYESPNTMKPPLSEYTPYFQNLKFCHLYLVVRSLPSHNPGLRD
ncbi:hypothetical protein NLJ89_g10097 [Agrocybe chaxingu]|uniref:Uncharacterized protein n=1 Tax=Agrocybe chaxingu TaxID=84603 RepID=A0A9W8JRE4_9AGAR|nr:hypothetical protein NLJ89_g10097 [Agrocybe chaxingu]